MNINTPPPPFTISNFIRENKLFNIIIRLNDPTNNNNNNYNDGNDN